MTSLLSPDAVEPKASRHASRAVNSSLHFSLRILCLLEIDFRRVFEPTKCLCIVGLVKLRARVFAHSILKLSSSSSSVRVGIVVFTTSQIQDGSNRPFVFCLSSGSLPGPLISSFRCSLNRCCHCLLCIPMQQSLPATLLLLLLGFAGLSTGLSAGIF